MCYLVSGKSPKKICVYIQIGQDIFIFVFVLQKYSEPVSMAATTARRVFTGRARSPTKAARARGIYCSARKYYYYYANGRSSRILVNENENNNSKKKKKKKKNVKCRYLNKRRFICQKSTYDNIITIILMSIIWNFYL